MCGTCGCAAEADIRLFAPDGATATSPGHDHGLDQARDHDHGHDHDHGDGAARTIPLGDKVLAKNDALARRNRDWLLARNVLAVNLMSSPGAGKTTLLERTATDLHGQLVLSVIEGDQETALDADRMRRAGCRVVQVNTGTGCHLDAAMVARALGALDPPGGSVVVIENVGNLVCPALFDLGEAYRVVLASVTEGADKPAKYPHMFRHADIVLINKTDLVPYLDFDVGRLMAGIKQVSPGARVLPLSARSGDGIVRWYEWLRHPARPEALR